MRRLSKILALRCEHSQSKRCECRCAGLLHGKSEGGHAHSNLQNERHDPGVQYGMNLGELEVRAAVE